MERTKIRTLVTIGSRQNRQESISVRQMLGKLFHQIDSDVPIVFGKTLDANCGEKVVNAVAAMEYDTDSGLAVSLDAGQVCPTCLQKSAEGIGTRWIYLIRPGQEAIDLAIA